MTVTVVSDEWRSESRSGVMSEEVQALLEGKTILVTDYRSGRYFNTLRTRGFRLHTRRRAEGTVLWAEPING